MLKLTIRNLLAHKRRLVGTFCAVLIGVAFFTGVMTLSATFNKTFNDLFSNGNKGTDAYVRSTSTITVDQGPGTRVLRGHIDASLLDTVRGVPGVKDVQPFVEGYGRIVTASGKALGNPDNGPPVFAEAWIDDPDLNGWKVVDGRGPQQDGEIVIDRKSSKDGNVRVGDKVTITGLPVGNVPATVVGIATYSGEDSSGGTTYAAFTVAQAERDVLNAPGKIDGIKVVGDGQSQQALVDRISPVLPTGIEAITGAALVKDLEDSIQREFLNFFNIFFDVLAAIAVIVAVFSIYNTFSIIVAQRTREMALLRAIGAGRGQVLRSVLLEALVLGATASAIGVAFGAVLALGLRSLMSAVGFGLPSSSFAFGVSSVVQGIVLGVVVTVLAGLIPAVRATRIPPLAALRRVAYESTRVSKVRVAIGGLLLAIGALEVVSAALGSGDNRPAAAGLGTFLLLLSLVVLGPIVAQPVSGALGSPLPKMRGVTGQLARENAMRNPRRTSGTAMALMIGVAVVSLFTIFGESIKATIDRQINQQFAGDLVIGNGFGNGGISPALATELSQQPVVKAATGLRFGVVQIDGKAKQVNAGTPSSLTSVMHIDVVDGSVDQLGPTQLAVADDIAKDHHWVVGSRLPVHFLDGSETPFTIAAIYKQSQLLGGYLMSVDGWQAHTPESTDSLVLVKLKDGVSPTDGKAALKPLVDKEAAGQSFYTRAEFKENQAGQINQFLGFVYLMLVVAIIISLMGIANTLSLSITERTREIGLSRAVGMARSQLRAMIRFEGGLIALFGTIGGLALGVVASWAVVRSTGEAGLQYRLPFGSLFILIVLGAGFGILSAVLPSRRAARMDVLAAIAHE